MKLLLSRGDFWCVGVQTGFFMIVVGRSFLRNIVGIEIALGHNENAGPGCSWYRCTRFVRFWK